MRKVIIAAFFAVLVFAGGAYSEVIGRHTIFTMTEQEAVSSAKATLDIEFYAGIDPNTIEYKFYDSLSAMLLALEKGEIDSITVPRDVGLYMIENNSNLALKGFNYWQSMCLSTLSLGCLENNIELINKFNEAVSSMRKDGTLAILEKKYINNFMADSTDPVKFDTFDDAAAITVALTGDLPPIDYIAADGTPAGFNTAVLAELGRRLHINIKTMHVDSGARVAALTSGRADAVFWFRGNVMQESMRSKILVEDFKENVVLSVPYYSWNEQYIITKK